MRIIGDSSIFGVLGREVSSSEEALRALSRGVARRLEWGISLVWGYLHPDDVERPHRCGACGAALVGGILARRRLGAGEEAPLGVREPLDALPAATLDAIARHGVAGVAWELRR